MFSRIICIQSKSGIILSPIIYELLGDYDSGLPSQLEKSKENNVTLFVWPCAIVLSAYLSSIYSNDYSRFKDDMILEIGAGVGLPSIVSALLGFTKVIITDRENEPNIAKLQYKNIEVNNINKVCTIKSMDWGNLQEVSTLPNIDIILGSDVFYSTEDFNSVLLTISIIFEKNPNSIF